MTSQAERLLGNREPRQRVPGLTPAQAGGQVGRPRKVGNHEPHQRIPGLTPAQAGGQVGRPRKLRAPAQGNPSRRALVATQPRTGRAWKHQRRPKLERGDYDAPTSPANAEKGAWAAQSRREREEQKAESYQEEEKTAKHHGLTE